MEPGREGGTWLAISTKGRIGALLNLTGEKRYSNATPIGRGFLVKDYVISDVPTEVYLSKLHEKNRNGQPYNPYNLILIDIWKADVYCLSSSKESTGVERCVENIAGFGNSTTDRPYRKVTTGKKQFQRIVENTTVANVDKLVDELMELLKCKEKHLPDFELQRREPSKYADLSSICVDMEYVGYGTRTHSVLLVDGSNRAKFIEKTLLPDKTWNYQSFEVPIEL